MTNDNAISDSVEIGGDASTKLKLHIEAIERLTEERQAISDDMKDRYKLAKSEGFDTSIMKTVIKRRKLGDGAVREAEALLETYEKAINLQLPLPLQAEIRTPGKPGKAVH